MRFWSLLAHLLTSPCRRFQRPHRSPLNVPAEDRDPGPEEYVLRRFSAKDYDLEASPEDAVKRVAFRPNEDRDFDGLSLFRETFTSAADLASRGAGKFGYYVARLKVQDLLNLGLTIKAKPDTSQPRGHCVIPEIRAGLRGHAKELSKEMQEQLSKLAARDIALRPRNA